MLTPGQAHDLTCAEPLLEGVDPEALIGDKAYDANPFGDTLTERGITPVIPPKANRTTQRACDFSLYCERNLIERFFNLLKHFRAIATRYDKLARNALGRPPAAQSLEVRRFCVNIKSTKNVSKTWSATHQRKRVEIAAPRRGESPKELWENAA